MAPHNTLLIVLMKEHKCPNIGVHPNLGPQPMHQLIMNGLFFSPFPFLLFFIPLFCLLPKM